MEKKFPEYENLNLPFIAKEILERWEKENVFEKSVSSREGKPPFVFYEGPPSANGMPGIHHVMSRTIKDLFCRYKTLKGFQVKRKAGWDTHGLPVELAVEKELGITKEDIGTKISIEDYNKECRKAVMKYKNVWDDLTKKMGYWVDLENPYITYENNYIESVWYLLKMLYDKKLLYKGYTIQPYSPAAGTGLSSHELNLPGCYKNVKDNTVVAMFKVVKRFTISSAGKSIWTKVDKEKEDIFFLAWTTTPWTLSSNTALAVGAKIKYVLVKTFNQYSGELISVILAKDLLHKYFPEKNAELIFEKYKKGDKHIPFKVVDEFLGQDLEGIYYEQLLPYVTPTIPGTQFSIIIGDFVSTEDGTGIVHIAPTFGADDMRVAKQNGISGILVKDENGELTPLVDKRGRFVKEMHDEVWSFAGEFVKEEFLSEEEKQKEFQKQKKILESAGKIKELKEYLSVDKRITLKLQEEGKLFKKEIYEHNYPHCWRTDKPILYYPLDSWFIKTTAAKERMIELNKTINWKPEHTGTGRFGEWLNNLQDWNLSRSRYWGIPLPIWKEESPSPTLPNGKGEKKIPEEKCIGTIEELSTEIDFSISVGFMKSNPFKVLPNGEDLGGADLHRPYVDEIILVSSSGKPMYREKDLIDVWFDSGAMPFAQWGAKSASDKNFRTNFPADYIAEGVDQTRGWFYTLHAIATMCFDSVAYKNVVSNGLVLDKNGQKMSKRLGNVVNPFDTIEKFGADATRWYLITNSQPWDNLKFDSEGISEVQKKFFRALYNTYAFFALYANIDGFTPNSEHQTVSEPRTPNSELSEMDKWILSELNFLIKEVEKNYENYEPTLAGRMIEDFTVNKLSNWYVRLNRRRFWKGDFSEDKITAYHTLYKCLETVAILASPIAPFYCERLYRDLKSQGLGVQSSETANSSKYGEKNSTLKTVSEPRTKNSELISVHLAAFPQYDETLINLELQEKMEIAQKISSLVLSLRKKQNIRVRQPLQKIMVPSPNPEFERKLNAVKDLILSEVNVKQMEIISVKNAIFQKKIKPDFKKLGPKYGKMMKAISEEVNKFTQEDISALENNGNCEIIINNEKIFLQISDFEILSQSQNLGDSWQVASESKFTVALDTAITEELKEEGIAREIVNKIQNIRKDKGFEVTDKILLKIQSHKTVDNAIKNNINYICSETLATTLNLVDKIQNGADVVEVEEGIETLIQVEKNN